MLEMMDHDIEKYNIFIDFKNAYDSIICERL